VSTIPPGWYKDPADPTTQRWWDGEGWLGDPIPADATPPDGPPQLTPEPPAAAPAGTTPSGPTGAGPVSAGPAGAGPTGAGAPPVEPAAWPMSHRHPVAVPRPQGLAGVGARFMARLVDVLVVLVLAAVANFWFAIEFWRSIRPVVTWAMNQPTNWDTIPASADRAAQMMILMGVVLTAVWFAYEVPASANTGQTLGKRIFGIRVVREESDERLGFGRSFRRWFRLAWPTPFWVVCYGVPLLLQVVDCLFLVIDRRRRQALHDRIAQTVVVQVRGGQPPTIPAPPGPGAAEHVPTSPSGSTGDGHADPR
jgi:uncharacterized RDD family membrane protein YckC